MEQLDADLLRIGKSTEMMNVRSVTYRFESCPDCKHKKVMKQKYVTCKNASECDYTLHNMKDYLVVAYDTQPYGIGWVVILLPNGNTKCYPKTKFSKVFEKQSGGEMVDA